MINWNLKVKSSNQVFTYDLLSDTPCLIKELDYIQVIVKIKREIFTHIGEPIIVIGDTEFQLEEKDSDHHTIIFSTVESLTSTNSRLFYNFFGTTRVTLYFSENTEKVYHADIEVMAKKENAVLANKMLDFIYENLAEYFKICFLSDKKTAQLNNDTDSERIDSIKLLVEHFTQNIPAFKREYKFEWKHVLDTTEQGKLVGVASVDWVLKNLDKISPCTNDEANIIFNNRGYKLIDLPTEALIKDTDIYENRVINSFLHNAEQYLIQLSYNLPKRLIENNNTQNFNEYVRFEQAMDKYVQLMIKYQSKEVEDLILKIRYLRGIFNKYLPSKSEGIFSPKHTSYTLKHIHYRKAFQLIEQFYTQKSTSQHNIEFFSGLKNLSKIYEITSLLLIYKVLNNDFNANIVAHSYRNYDNKKPLSGEEAERLNKNINNYFCFKNQEYDFELFYEAKIFPLSSSSMPGDLVDTSNFKYHRIYGKHHLCPDFVLKINSDKWSQPLVIIMDAKYKNSRNVERFDIDKITKKYLLNLHQLKENRSLGTSNIKLALALFGHDFFDKKVFSVLEKHSITGKYPVLPQAAGIYFFPQHTELLKNKIQSIIEIIDKESL